MQSILAIALISIRNAIRSKLVIVLLFFLLITLAGLPLTLRGDGTAAGHVRLMLRYTLGLSTLILSIATVWTSCAAISTEIRDRQIQMLMSKPVHAAQLWLGKWLGLTAMNAVLLFLCASVTYGALLWTTRPGQLTEEERTELTEEILLAQRPLTPISVPMQNEIRQAYLDSRQRGEWPEEVTTSQIMPIIERRVRARIHSVAPGSFNRWTFRTPRLTAPDRPLLLRYRIGASTLDLEPIQGQWQIGPPGSGTRESYPVSATPRTWQSLLIPADLINSDNQLTIEFANTHARPVTLIFEPEDDLRLLVYQGSFLPNYARAILLILLHLGFLAAIGITAGAWFSIPVAAMFSFYMLLLLQAGRFIGQIATREVHVAQSPDVSWFAETIATGTYWIYALVNLVIQPVYAINPLEPVSAGEWISWAEVGTMLVIRIFVYSGLLMLIGVWHLRRKEVALPL